MISIIHKLKQETIHAIPGMIFFILAFNFIVLTESLMIEHHMVMPISYFAATVGGLIAGKFLIIVNSMPFINAFPNKPLIYNITWKLFIYGLFSFIFRILDIYLHLVFRKVDHTLILKELPIALTSPIFWSVQLWIIILLFIYVIVVEFTRVIGKAEMRRIIIG